MLICNMESCPYFGNEELCKHGVPHSPYWHNGLNSCDYPCNAGTIEDPNLARREKI
ncbi:MAG: hypothetical protein AMQ22_00012 [Candidatus Methanofastidiosum methylothiophilum]|uniref:Uncharacterized protein n=1 Tax=Candidatus Methanofastidiosum methylothiophilum TaxID=1705564 RepID=A0A150J969_9EURY|nr:MAG: hypothetical protein AMQ22_00012 [Candidatus Methanofastidiosum methylthiophilus]